MKVYAKYNEKESATGSIRYLASLYGYITIMDEKNGRKTVGNYYLELNLKYNKMLKNGEETARIHRLRM